MRLARWLYDRIPDRMWPHLTGDEEPAPKDQDYLASEHIALLDEARGVLASRLAQTEERGRVVESKLTALLTLTSVLSAAIIAGSAAAFTIGRVEENAEIFAWAMMVLIFYVAMQLLRSLWATVTGLVRRGYRELSPGDMIPGDGETSNAYLTRLWNLQANFMRYNEWVIDLKVSEMAVAHAALRNALTATFILVVLVLALAAAHLSGLVDSNDINAGNFPPLNTKG